MCWGCSGRAGNELYKKKSRESGLWTVAAAITITRVAISTSTDSSTMKTHKTPPDYSRASAAETQLGGNTEKGLVKEICENMVREVDRPEERGNLGRSKQSL